MADDSASRQDMRRLAALLTEASEITRRMAGGGTDAPLPAGRAVFGPPETAGEAPGKLGFPLPAGALGTGPGECTLGAVSAVGPALVITPTAFYNLAEGEHAEVNEKGPVLIVSESTRCECAPELVARIAAPFSSASKAMILKTINRPGYRTSTEIMEESGLSAGQFYHHLKEILKAGLAVKRGRDEYRLSEAGRRAVTVVASLCGLLRGQRGLEFARMVEGTATAEQPVAASAVNRDRHIE